MERARTSTKAGYRDGECAVGHHTIRQLQSATALLEAADTLAEGFGAVDISSGGR